MLDIKSQIEAKKGVTYEPNCFMTPLFDKFSGYNNEMYCYEFIATCSTYNKGKMIQDEVFEALKMVYKIEQAAGTWANLMPSKYKITMLTTNLAKKANNELKKMKLQGSGGGRGGGGDRGGGTRRGNCNCGAKKGGGGGNNAAISCSWMLTKTTNTIMHPTKTKDYNMKWCKLCGPGSTRGTPAGLYMQAPHDHAEWLLNKEEKLANFDANKKSLMAEKSKAGDDTNSTNNNVKRLKLSNSIINGLTTEIMIRDSKACKMAKRWFQNANEGIQLPLKTSKSSKQNLLY
jgi:hypothetical protein